MEYNIELELADGTRKKIANLQAAANWAKKYRSTKKVVGVTFLNLRKAA